MMKNDREESGIKKAPLLYDAGLILADVKNGCGFYEACKREQSKKMSPGRKSLAVLVDGLKLLSFPEETFYPQEDDMPDSLRRLSRMTREFCIDVYGGKESAGVYPVKKRIYDLLENLHDKKEKSKNEKRLQNERESVLNNKSGKPQSDIPSYPDIYQGGSAEQGMYPPQPDSAMQQMSPVQQTQYPSGPYVSPEAMSQFPPVEVNGPLTDEQKSMLYEMLLANGCTPQEAQTEIMNLGM